VTPAVRDRRVALLITIAVVAVVTMLLVPPIRQDLAYHHFADQRAILAVPHALNVLSNVGFLLAGVWSLVAVSRATLPGWERVAGLVFGVGLVLTGLGSAWYHAAPGNATLVWDRLPLSALFPTVFAVVIGDRVSERAGFCWPPWRSAPSPACSGGSARTTCVRTRSRSSCRWCSSRLCWCCCRVAARLDRWSVASRSMGSERPPSWRTGRSSCSAGS